MKYYKLINQSGWRGNYEKGKIYPEDYTGSNLNTVIQNQNNYPRDFKEVTKAEYNKQEGIVPKPRVKKVIVDPHVFKIGDKVEFIHVDRADGPSLDWGTKECIVGQKYIVSEIHSGGTAIRVKSNSIPMKYNYWINKLQFKLSTQTKLKRTEMENYSIAGSKALKTAFVEECKLILSSGSTISDYIYFTSEDKPKGTVQGTGIKKNQHFVLPKDWEKAVKYVTEFNTPKPVFKIGDWVVVLPEDEFYYNCDKENAQQITSIDSLSDRTPYNLNFPNGDTNSYAKVRKATAVEIKAATIARENLYKMAGYVSKIDKSAKTISFGCQTYTKAEVKLLLDAAKLCERVGYSAKVKASGFVVNEIDILTPDSLTKILAQLK